MGSDGYRRGPWSQAEDRRLLQCIKAEGPQNWVAIAKEVGGRSAKQCRERYHQNLRPGLNHTPLTESEAEYVSKQVSIRGPRWAEISRELNNNRSDNMVKNWWNGNQNRNRRLKAREDAAKKAVEEAKASQNKQASRPVSTTSRNREAQMPCIPYATSSRHGPAPLPSPTDNVFSPRAREAALTWSRDTLPPSPSSIVSDHSLSSRTRFETIGPYGHSRYHAPNMDARLLHRSPPGRAYIEPIRPGPPENFRHSYRSHVEREQYGPWTTNEYDYGFSRSYWDRPSSAEESRGSSLEPFSSYHVPRSELRQPDERQYYHSHQLPLRTRYESGQAAARHSGEGHAALDGPSDYKKVPAPRIRDERMSVSALMD